MRIDMRLLRNIFFSTVLEKLIELFSGKKLQKHKKNNMGIKGLSKIIKKVAPYACKETSMEQYRGQSLAVDVPIFMYKFTYFDPENPINGFVEQLQLFETYDITPIYVFDGVACDAKKPELEKRKEIKQNAVNTLTDAEKNLLEVQQQCTVNVGGKRKFDPAKFGALADAQTYFQKAEKRVASVPKKSSYTELELLLTSRGIDWVQAAHDAEKVCSQLVSNKKCYAVVSEDFDTLPYLAGGGGRGKFVTGFGKASMVEYDIEKVLNGFNMTPAQFIDFCILSGCDLCKKITNVAGKRAMTMVQSYGTIENILRCIDRNKYPVPESFRYDLARKEFNSIV